MQASYEKIYGYQPNSKVTDHNAIDLDQRDMEAELSESTVDYANAKLICECPPHSIPIGTGTVAWPRVGGRSDAAFERAHCPPRRHQRWPLQVVR